VTGDTCKIGIPRHAAGSDVTLGGIMATIGSLSGVCLQENLALCGLRIVCASMFILRYALLAN